MNLETPLFIALKTIYFNQFKDGSKDKERRLYGPRWNCKTCPVGRRVTLSKGYGKHERLSGVVTSFRRYWGHAFKGEVRASILDCYGTLDVEIAEIGILVFRDDDCPGCVREYHRRGVVPKNGVNFAGGTQTCGICKGSGRVIK